MVHFTAEDKGERICISGSLYSCLNGWHWVGKNDMAQYTYIIVKLQDGQEKGTRVKKKFVGPFNTPTNYFNAALWQYGEVKCTFNHLCKLLAKCNLNGSEEDLQHTFILKMQTVYANQTSKWSPTWFQVDFTADESATNAKM